MSATPQRLTEGGFMRTLAAAMERLGMGQALSAQDSAAAKRAWAAGERPGSFARTLKRARMGLPPKRASAGRGPGGGGGGAYQPSSFVRRFR